MLCPRSTSCRFLSFRDFKSMNNDPLLVYGEEAENIYLGTRVCGIALRLVDRNMAPNFQYWQGEPISIIELAHKIKEHTNSSSEIKLIF